MRRTPGTLRSNPSAGFTLLELMITLAVAAVLAAVAVPNMRDFLRNNRLTATANDLLRSTQIARSEAIKRQQVVTMCASANPVADEPACTNGAYSGWIVFQDTNNNWTRDAGEDVIDRQSIAAGVTVIANHDGVVSYASTGFANSSPGPSPSSRVVICDSRGNLAVGLNSAARVVFIEPTGRTRVSKSVADVSAAMSGADGTGACP